MHKPSLTGLGERELLTKETSLTTNINDITNYLKWYDLKGVVLVDQQANLLIGTAYKYHGIVDDRCHTML